MTGQPHLACMALKREPAAVGKRAPRKPSIAYVFCRLPELPFAADSVAPDVCLLALAGAQALPAAMHADVQNGSKLSTTRGGPASVGTAVRWPRSGGPELPPAFRTVKFTRSIKAVFNRPEKPKCCN